MTTVDNGSLVITGSADCSIRIWDLQSPPSSQTTQLHEGNVLTRLREVDGQPRGVTAGHGEGPRPGCKDSRGKGALQEFVSSQ